MAGCPTYRLANQRQEIFKLLDQAPGSFFRLTLQGVPHPFGLRSTCLGDLDELDVNAVFGLFVAPTIEVLDDQQAQDDLDWSGEPAPTECLGIVQREVGLDLLKEEVVGQKAFYLSENKAPIKA